MESWVDSFKEVRVKTTWGLTNDYALNKISTSEMISDNEESPTRLDFVTLRMDKRVSVRSLANVVWHSYPDRKEFVANVEERNKEESSRIPHVYCEDLEKFSRAGLDSDDFFIKLEETIAILQDLCPKGDTARNCIQTFIDAGTMSTYCQGLIF